METVNPYDWRKEWLNKPFHRNIYGCNDEIIKSVELELIQIEQNECVLLARTQYKRLSSYLGDEKVYEGIKKNAFVGYNCLFALLAYQKHLSLNKQRVGCNGVRKNFLLNKLHVRQNFGLSGVIADKNEGYAERKELPPVDTFGEFNGSAVV
jgi:hypothetical protein